MGTDTNIVGGPNGGISIFNSGDQDRIDAAVELLKYYVSPEMTVYKIEEYGGIFPVKTDLQIGDLSPIFKEFQEVLYEKESLSIDYAFYCEYLALFNGNISIK